MVPGDDSDEEEFGLRQQPVSNVEGQAEEE